MDLAERCGVCSSWKWCGRPCKNTPQSAEIVPLPVKAPKVKRPGRDFLPKPDPPKLVEPGKFDRNAYQRELMRKRRAKSKP